jgi:spermidine synthase
MKSRLLPAGGLVFGSGLCALLYQTTWLRELRLVFGSSTAASAAVLGIFMAGLGAGSALLGRRAEGKTRPLAFYAKLEFLIAASAAVTPGLIWMIRALYVALGGTLAMGDIAGTIIRLLFATIVLGTPTFLMGGTLPAMARFALDEEDDSRRGLALLYGLNTLGAVAGAALGTFYLFERFGNHLTLWLACATNAFVALLAFWLARREAYRPLLAKPTNKIRTEAAAPFRLILVAAAVTGFVFLLMELVWYRMLSPILGGTTFTFGLILAVALAGMGLGGVAYSLCAGRRTPTLNAFAVTCALEALFLAVPYALGDRLALAAMLLQPLGALGFYGHVVAWTALAGIIIAPAAFVAGIQFPLLLGLLGKGREEVGAQTGSAYAWNTAGAIAGSFAGGFGFIPWLSAPGTWKVVVLALVACAFLAAVIAQRGMSKPLRAVPSLLAGTAAICLLFALGPTAAWRHSQLGVGIVKKYEGSPNQIHDFLNIFRRDLLWEVDGREVSIGISKTSGLAFVVNGKCDGNVRGDAGTQVMSGLLGTLIHPHPTSAAVIGLGTGSTTGWLAAVPSMERVDVMEIEPAITKFAGQCAPVNHDALTNPKVHLLYGDARELLLTSRQKYDVIVSEPSNPYRAGIASLFTHEYYQAIAEKLNHGGFFAQWLQAYDVDQRTIQIFYATLSSVFPHIETWRTQDNDLLLIGSQEPMTYDVPALRERITQEPFKSALAKVWRATDLESVFSHYVGNDKLPRVVMRNAEVPLNTDDRTLLEFAFARNLRADNSYGLDGIRRDAHFFAADHPPGTDALDWASVELQRIEMFVSSDHPARSTDAMSDKQHLLVEVLNSYVKDDLSDALQYWKRIGREPHGLIELVMVAEILAEDGDPAALPYIRQIQETNHAEAQAIEARLLWNQEHFEEAAAMAASALEAFRTDPWPLCDLITRTVALASKIAADDKEGAVAQMLFRALEKPFAVYNMDESRLMALFRIGMDIDHGHGSDYTLRGIQQAEPYVPWQLNFLKVRSACYTSLHHPLSAQARDDLTDYLAAESGAVETKGVPEVLPLNRVADGR